MTTLTHTVDLVVVTCWCGVGHAVPHPLYDEAHRTGKSLYCPLGHSYGWQSEIAELRKQVAELETRLTWARQAAARKGQLTKAFNRAARWCLPALPAELPGAGRAHAARAPDRGRGRRAGARGGRRE